MARVDKQCRGLVASAHACLQANQNPVTRASETACPPEPLPQGEQRGFLSAKATEHEQDSSVPAMIPEAQTTSKEEIQTGLGCVLGSRTFAKSPRLKHLLAHIITQWVEGNTGRLDGYNIAVDVFQRDAFFDSGLDPIVRVEIARLRKQLTKYYEGEGEQDSLRIEIPKGGYVPMFSRRSICEEEGVSDLPTRSGITVMVLPFSQQNDGNSLHLYDHLLCLLTQEPGFRVLSRFSSLSLASGKDSSHFHQQIEARFVVEGTVSCVGEQYHMILHLSDSMHGYNLWSGRYITATHSVGHTMSLVVRNLAEEMQRTAGLI